MKNKIFRKSLAFVLSLAMIISAMSCLLLVPAAAAQDYSKLTATFDFDNNGSAADFVQVGGKTGAETATGYESWNYDPLVGSASGFEKYTISAHEIDYADESTVKLITSPALIARPYLNATTSGTSRADIYIKSNTATSATNYSKEVTSGGNTSLFAPAATVDANGVAHPETTGISVYQMNLLYTGDIFQAHYCDTEGWFSWTADDATYGALQNKDASFVKAAE